MKELIILVGIPGSGKTTHYINNHLGTHLHINLDTLGTRGREWAIFKTAVNTETSIVIDNTNITIAKRKRYIDYVKDKEYYISIIYFHEKLETCIERIKRRERKIPTGIVHEFYKNLEEPSLEEGVQAIYIHKGSENKWT